MQDDRTSHLNLPLPYVENDLSTDVERLRNALTLLDQFASGGTIEAARRLATARTINGVAFDGSGNISITAPANGGSADSATSATTAERLATARTINGVQFDGTQNITITAAANGGSADSANSATTAERLATARTINGVEFDGTANINIGATDDSKLPLTGGEITSTTESTSPTTGALRCLGGLGVSKNIYSGGNIHAAGNVTAFSDARLKTDIQRIEGALAKVARIRGVTFTDIATKERRTGVIAQELQEVLPEAVVKNGEYLAVAYGNVVGLLIEAVNELSEKVEAMKPKRSSRRGS